MGIDNLSELVKTLEDLAEYKETNKMEFYIPYDFQKAFHHALDGEVLGSGNYDHTSDGSLAVQRALMTANQIGKCVTYHTLIDHPDGTSTKAGELYKSNKPFPVMSWDGFKLVESTAVFPIKKPAEECFRVLMDNGQWFECAANHRVLTSQGWIFFEQLRSSLLSLPESSSEFGLLTHASDVLRYFETSVDSLSDYPYLSRLYDEQPLAFQDNDRASSPFQADAQQHSGHLWHLDGLVSKYKRILSEQLSHLANLGAYLQSAAHSFASLFRTHSIASEPYHGSSPLYSQHHSELEHLSQLAFEAGLHLKQPLPPSLVSPISSNKIVAYQSVGVHDVYDFTVPEYGNYYSRGAVHHNTTSAAMEVAMHTTGIYPDWWEGTRFDEAINCVCAGKSNDSVRDVVQNELLGDPFSEEAIGTGTIPKHLIGKTTRKAGVPNAKSAVMIKHTSGKWSKIRFMAYEQGADPYMGIRFHVGWMDEEPPQPVWTQFIRATISRPQSLLLLTFTPEEGVTEVVDGFINNLTSGQSLIKAGWDDAGHMTKERQEQLLSQLPPHERDMRSKGIPLMGSGLVFPVNEDDIKIEPFPIPSFWPQICGIDFGWDHPFAAVWLAWDRDKDIVYVTDCYRVSKALPPIHASAIKKRANFPMIPVVWPHDGLNTDKGSGIPLASQYRSEGLNLLSNKFSNPPSPNQKEGQGGNGIEAGLFDMLTRMEEGRLKVFGNLSDWFEERRQYHRKDGKVVALREDLMSASRYAIMSLRFASVKPQPRRITSKRTGISNW